MQLSTSQIGVAATCLKRYEYAYIDRLVRKPSLTSAPLRRGSWVHRALECYHQGQDWRPAVQEMYDWCLAQGVPASKLDEINLDVGLLMNGYHTFWSQKPPLGQTLAAEERISAQFGAHTLSATVDLRVQVARSSMIVEHKTTSQIPNATWRAIDPQTALQFAIYERNGVPIDGIIFNYILTAKPPVPKWKKDGQPTAVTLKMTTTSAAYDLGMMMAGVSEDPALRAQIVNDAAYYQRFFVLKPVNQVRGTLLDVASLMRNLADAKATGHYRRLNSLLHCPRFCSYSELCSTEYWKGGPAPLLRSTQFVIDDGVNSREGVVRS